MKTIQGATCLVKSYCAGPTHVPRRNFYDALHTQGLEYGPNQASIASLINQIYFHFAHQDLSLLVRIPKILSLEHLPAFNELSKCGSIRQMKKSHLPLANLKQHRRIYL